MTENKTTLYGKMCQVMKQMARAKETGRHSQGWAYATSEDIKDVARAAMSDVGLALLINLDEHEVVPLEGKGVIVRGKMAFTLCCSETGETVTSYLWGEAADQAYVSDKAFYKLYTTLEKYFLKTTFLISSGDDLDSDSGNSQQYKPAQKKPPANGQVSNGKVTKAKALEDFLEKTKQGLNLSAEATKAILKENGHSGFSPDKVDEYYDLLKAQLEESATTETAMLIVANAATNNHYDNIHHLRNTMAKLDPGFAYPPGPNDHVQWQVCLSMAIEYANAPKPKTEVSPQAETDEVPF